MTTYNTLEAARTVWEKNLEPVEGFQVISDGFITAWIIVDEGKERYGMIRYWDDQNNKWHVSHDHKDRTLPEIMNVIAQNARDAGKRESSIVRMGIGDE